MRKVILATPASLSHSVDAYYHHSVIDTLKACAKADIDLIPLTWPGEALVQIARNALADMALRAGADEVVWVDADQEWTPDQFLRLLSHKVDVVGAAYPKKSDTEDYPVRTGPQIAVRDGLWVVQSVGTGFLRTSRAALAAVWNDSAEYEYNGMVHRAIFDVQVLERRLWGEDTVFCAKLTDLGYPIHVDPTFTVGHNGYKRYRGDFAKFIRRQGEEHARQSASGRTG